MDKLLLAAFMSTLAGFITAIISIVKLVNEKESKISVYRQTWNDSARKSFADLASKLTAITANFEEQARFSEIVEDIHNKLANADNNSKDELEKRLDHLSSNLKSTQADKRHAMYLSYA